MRPELVNPFPKWTVRHGPSGQGCTSFERVRGQRPHAVYEAPDGTAPLDAAIRAHELAHAWLDGQHVARERPEDVDPVAWQLAMDCAVTHLLAVRGLAEDVNAAADHIRDRATQEAGQHGPGFAIARLVSGSPGVGPCWGMDVQPLAALAEAIVTRSKVATCITRLAAGAPTRALRVRRTNLATRAVHRLARTLTGLIAPPPGPLGGKELAEQVGTELPDLSMEIVNVTAPAHRSQKGHRPADVGCVPVRMASYPVDHLPFRRPVRKPPCRGSILVDASGSMGGLHADKVQRLVDQGWHTVAYYSGHEEHEGQLVIVAQGARAVSRDATWPPSGGGNVVDLPALEWLARQPGPARLWVSDGEAGCGGMDNGAYQTLCLAVCHYAGIRRVDDTATALAMR